MIFCPCRVSIFLYAQACSKFTPWAKAKCRKDECMKRVFPVILVCVLCVLPLSAAASPLQQYITRDCAVFVHVDKFNDILTEAEGYAIKFGVPIGKGQLGALLSMQLTGKVGFPGLDLTRPIGLFLLKNGNTQDTVFMLPVSDQNTFQKLMDERPTFVGSSVRYRNRYAIIADNARVQDAFERGAKKTVSALPDAQILLYADTALLKGEMQDVITEMSGNANKETRQLADALTKMYTDVIGEMKAVTYGLSFNARGMEIVSGMEASPQGAFASLVKSLPAGEPALIAKMPADSYLAVGSKINLASLQPMAGVCSDVFDAFFPGLGSISADLIKDAGEIYGDDAAFAMAPGAKGGFTALGAGRLLADKDSRALMQKFTERFNALPAVRNENTAPGKLTLVYTPNAGRVGADAYDRMRLDYVPGSAKAQDNPEMKAAAALLRDFCTLYIAKKDGVEYWAMGGDAERRLADLLNGTRPGFTTTAAWRSITGSYGQFARNGVGYMSTSGLVQEIVRVLPLFGLGEGDMKTMLESLKKIPAGGGIYGIMQTANETITGRGTISKDEIDVFYSLVMSVSKAMNTGKSRPKR